MSPQRHLDRLRAMDASFLLQEGPTSHAHVGGVAILAGPLRIDDVTAQLAGRLDQMPRYRQRIAHTALDRARPVWVDDTEFDLTHHVHRVTLPAPGDRERFHRAVASAYSKPLDRSRPLWEIWLIDDLEDRRCALLFKTHHAMVDGSAAIDLLKIFCDVAPDPAPIGDAHSWQPHPTPGTLQLVGHAARGAAFAAVELAASAARASKQPRRTVTSTLEVLQGTGGLVRELLRTPPETPLTTAIGPDRRFVGVPSRLDDIKLVKNTFGCTVNDVVLAVVTGALRTFLLERGVGTDGLELSALVPVSVRAEHEHGQLGNRLAVLRGSLPVHAKDPVGRLSAVTEAMAGLKRSKQLPATEFVLAAQDYLPPMVLPILTRVNVSPRMFNLIVTNIPGPQLPLYVLGRELLELYPIALLQPNHTLAIAVSSYNGQLNFGVLGDYEAMADIDVVSDGINAGIAELVARSRKAAVSTRRPRSRPTNLRPVPA